MRKRVYVVVGILIIAYLVLRSRSEDSRWYRFIVADEQLFALEYTGAYGTEQRLFSTRNLGDSWERVEAPSKTCAIASNGAGLVVATSKGEIWRKFEQDTSWKRIYGPPLSNPYFYAILHARSGKILAVGKDAVYQLDSDGNLDHKFPTLSILSDQDELFSNASFASDDEKHLIIEANPFAIYVIDLEQQTMQPWLDGVPSSPPNLSGPGRVRRFGEGFLLSHPTGIYVSKALLEPWQLLNSDICHDGELGGNFCRDLIGYSEAPDRWLVATNSGINAMENGNVSETVYSDKPGEHYLIREFTYFRGYYFVSFARLKDQCMGIRLDPDLSKWAPLWLGEQPSH